MRKFLLWLFRLTGIGFIRVPRAEARRVEAVVLRVEAIPGVVSGDYRRSIAMGLMLKRHPKTDKRDAAMAIEYVIRQGVLDGE